jgi:hypothetical protein
MEHHMATKGKESDREKGKPKTKSGEHRKQKQGGNGSRKW